MLYLKIFFLDYVNFSDHCLHDGRVQLEKAGRITRFGTIKFIDAKHIELNIM